VIVFAVLDTRAQIKSDVRNAHDSGRTLSAILAYLLYTRVHVPVVELVSPYTLGASGAGKFATRIGNPLVAPFEFDDSLTIQNCDGPVSLWRGKAPAFLRVPKKVTNRPYPITPPVRVTKSGRCLNTPSMTTPTASIRTLLMCGITIPLPMIDLHF